MGRGGGCCKSDLITFVSDRPTITYQKRWITPEQLGAIADKYAKNIYGEYLCKLLGQIP
ncbi:hypothetical protein NWP21_04350 [Anabaenopsis sp. FSS-46]|uniref:hypothetical protein n=1 Tax=Anabaenopsis sp. FSS-46 TaxID=2971766 RepID=UPI00247565B5|nr:hypothetical protein [Anabaenopsis sp. FSS-46]MDH6098086.1 hypothetical protein [Anabaenopsis sp. FSS-46]